MNVALSRTGAWVLRSFFVLVVIFLYAPIAILVIFSFNDSQLPAFPLSGFTLHWYHEFLVNADLRSALETSAVVAAIAVRMVPVAPPNPCTASTSSESSIPNVRFTRFTPE